MREMYFTNSVVRRMMGLQPITSAIPELQRALDASPLTQTTKRKGCGSCRKNAHAIPVSACKVLAPIVLGLPEDKKQLILQMLNTAKLLGYIGGGPRPKPVVLAEKKSA